MVTPDPCPGGHHAGRTQLQWKIKVDSKVEKYSTSKYTKTEIINTFPKWFEGGLLTPGKSSMCATLARRTVTPTANLRERGEGGAVHCGALCSVYCFENSTVVISTELFLDYFQCSIYNLKFVLCNLQYVYRASPLCDRLSLFSQQSEETFLLTDQQLLN